MKGFTLIEIMISLVILGSSLVVLLGLRNRDIALSSEANHIVTATLLARERITLFSLERNKEITEKKGDFEEPYKDYKWAMVITKTPFPQMSELTMNVKWMEQNREEKVTMITYISQ